MKEKIKKLIKKIFRDSTYVLTIFLFGGILLCVIGYSIMLVTLQDGKSIYLLNGLAVESVGITFLIYFICYLFLDNSEL